MWNCSIALHLVPLWPSLLPPMAVVWVLKPQCFLYLLMFKIRVPLICLQPEPRSSWFSIYSPHPTNTCYHKKATLNFSMSKRILSYHMHILTFSSLPVLSNQCKGSKMNFCQCLHHGKITIPRKQQAWHQHELWLRWHVNSDRVDVQLPSLICNSTIVKDPKRTPATVTVSPSDLHELQNKLPIKSCTLTT